MSPLTPAPGMTRRSVWTTVRHSLAASLGWGTANGPGDPSLPGVGLSLIRNGWDDGPVVGVKVWAADFYVWVAPLWWKRRGWLVLDPVRKGNR